MDLCLFYYNIFLLILSITLELLLVLMLLITFNNDINITNNTIINAIDNVKLLTMIH